MFSLRKSTLGDTKEHYVNYKHNKHQITSLCDFPDERKGVKWMKTVECRDLSDVYGPLHVRFKQSDSLSNYLEEGWKNDFTKE